MPTVEDAIALVTNREYAAMGPSRADPVEMRAGEIVNALQQLGAADEIEARVLVTKAADQLGGRTAIDHVQGGLRRGGPQLRAQFRLWMPASALVE